MRASKLRLLTTFFAVPAALLAACDAGTATRVGDSENRASTNAALASSWGGGGGSWGGGGSRWGGGGAFWGAGGSFWGGGGSRWGGGSGAWGGGAGQWSAGGNWFAGGTGSFAGGGSFSGGGSGSFGAGGGGFWAGGGGWWTGAGAEWGGSSALWAGGYANTIPFLGWSSSRMWQFRGVPKQGYSPAAPPAFSVPQDTTTCAGGQVRLGGFAYPIDVESWPAFIALGYSKALCIPTPGGAGLTMNPTLGTASLTPTGLMDAGGYPLVSTLANASRDKHAMKTMVGFGSGNVATQYGGALCASIGTLAAAKRNCGVGVAFSDPNHNPDGSLSQRGIPIGSAQAGVFSPRTPFGRKDGNGLYGVAPGDMESYASHVLRRYTSTAPNKLPPLPESAGGISAWNSSTWNASTGAPNSYSLTGGDFTEIAISPSPDSAKLLDDANRSVTAPLNMIPVDPSTSTSTNNKVDLADMSQSVLQSAGELHLLTLHSLALHQSPLYGSGAGRWFFHDPADPNGASKPLMELSSIFQGSTYILTGQLSGLPSASTTISQAYVSQAEIGYADWRPDPSGALYIDRAGQVPAVIASDADKELRLAAALELRRPNANMGTGYQHTCAIASAGGDVKCWGANDIGQLGNGQISEGSNVPTDVVGLTGAIAVRGGEHFTCALTTGGAVKCWGYNDVGQLGDGTQTDSTAPVDVIGLASGVVAIATGGRHACALTKTGRVKCWGNSEYGQTGVDPAHASMVAVPTEVAGLNGDIVAITAGSDFTCALTRAGGVKCWGRRLAGNYGTGDHSPIPADVAALTSGIVAVEAGQEHACALTRRGGIKCWGNNNVGQCGNGRWAETEPTPVDVSGLTSGVIAIAPGYNHTCALTQAGGVKCWGDNVSGQVGSGKATNEWVLVPKDTTLTSGVSSIVAGSDHTCARLTSGGVKCWGQNWYGQIGDGTFNDAASPVAVSTKNGSVSNGSPMASQGSVLIHKGPLGSGPVSGHITPIPWSMSDATTGDQALIVTYDPLAAAAAIFIEQYDAHVAACKATSGEDMTEADQQAGTRLWACSSGTETSGDKYEYLSGLKTLLNGARHYLFGSDNGCIKSAQTVDGVACSSTVTGPDPVHFPYTFVVPSYTSAGFHPGYYSALNTALAGYRNALIDSAATRAEKTLQLAGLQKFTTDDAIVTTRLVRAGATDPTSCIVNDGFDAGPSTSGAALTFVAGNPAVVKGGASANGLVRLSAPAPSGGAVVSLVETGGSALVPQSVTVPAFATSASFPIATTAQATNTVATITARYGGVSQSNSILVTP